MRQLLRCSGWLALALVLAGFDGGFETTVRAQQAQPTGDRAATVVHRADLERRLPRSAPDALRFEPGVFVQQSAHGQGSAFIRGLTGQQTLLLFDGIRLNNSTWRQGPNQYFFTLDSKSLDSIEVLRGGASTRFGSDALGGVILAHPIEPLFDKPGIRASLLGRGASADGELGGRGQLSMVDGRWGVVAGVGARHAGLLESAGPLRNPADGMVTAVPRFAPDGRHQLGTGFDELTADGRVVFRASAQHSFTLAAYFYRQYDAPRTDLCPPATARFDECLTYEEQFRSLVYGAWTASSLGAAAQEARLTVSWQQQHERRALVRPASFVLERGEDDVDTLGLTFAARTRDFTLGTRSWLSWGADTYVDLVRSRASLSFSDIDVTVERSRGQYLQGSTSVTGGAFADAHVELGSFSVRAGTRVGWASANAPADAASATARVAGAWIPLAAHLGLTWQPVGALRLIANVDHSYRAPNLDDLTSRQQTGAGFQFENPALQPEQATTLEAGAQLKAAAVTAEAWAFHTVLTRAIGRAPRDVSQCPASTPACSASNFRYQLVNAQAFSKVSGVEASVRIKPHPSFTAQANAAWTVGEGPSLTDPALPQVPLSRIPPVNGTLELGWVHPSGGGLGAALRWAGPQTRLAVSDRSDSRIPLGGTPGFAVVDLRASWRVRSVLTVGVVFENVFDAAYRYHGSSVNGPGRGLMATLEVSPSWSTE